MSETYTVGGDTWQRLLNFEISGQTFTPTQNHTLYYVDLDLWLYRLVGPRVALKQCDATHTPIDPWLSFGDPISLPPFLPPRQLRVRFLMVPPINLVEGQPYALLVYRFKVSGLEINLLLYDKDDATYPRGHIIFSDNDGNTWTHFPNSDLIFCEFGAPPSPTPVYDAPIENFAPTGLTYIPLSDGIRFCLATSVPCHLTCYWTDVEPRKHRTTRTVRGLDVPWNTYYCFVAWREVEQTEPGDSLYHTFDLIPWPLGEIRYFTFRGEIDDIVSPSVGPIFKHLPIAYAKPSEKLFPDGPGDRCHYWLTGNGLPCPDHWQTVKNDPPLDDALMLIGNTFNHWWVWDYYTLPPCTISKIEKVTFHIRCKRTGSHPTAPVYGFQFKTHGTDYTHHITGTSPVWKDFSLDYATNPFTGNRWTQAEVNDLQTGIALRHTWGIGWTATGHCSQVYVEITRSIACPQPS